MTNGDVIKAILKPRTDQIRIYSTWVEIEIQNLNINFDCELSWWNAKYKEPTTKNDLGVEHHKQNIQAYAHNFGVSEEQAEKELAVKINLGVDCISRTQAQIEIEMNASRYTIAKERGGMGQVEWSDQLIKVSDAVDIIRNLPPVTPQPRKGHWIFDGDCLICSKCKKAYTFSGSNFCPDCGAEMKVSESEE